MVTYEEQGQILKEIKKLPEVKKLNVASKVCEILGYCLLIVGLGIPLWIIGGILGKKCKERINELLAMETARRQRTEQVFSEETEEKILVEETNIEREITIENDDGQGKVERLVSLTNRQSKLGLLMFGSVVLTWLLLFFLPFGKLLGIKGVSIFNLLREKSSLGEASLLYALKQEAWYIPAAALFFWVMGIFFVLFFAYMLIRYLLGIDEKAIRENEGEIRGALTVQEIRAGNLTTNVLSTIVLAPLCFGAILLYPIALLLSMQGAATVHIVSCVVVGALFLTYLTSSVLSAVLLCVNKEEHQLLLGINATYKRNKRNKRFK